MNKDEMITVPYILYEGEMARAERRTKHNFILIIVLIIALVISNLAWLYAWMQYDYSSDSELVTIDGGDRGIANYIGHDGDIDINGEDYSKENNEKAD